LGRPFTKKHKGTTFEKVDNVTAEA